MMDKNQVIGKISAQKAFLADKYSVKEIGVFGSVARGEQKADSDIDVLVDFKKPIGLFDYVRLENYLSGFLGAKVDLVTKTGLKPAIKDEILSQTIYA
ncbi:nucleotidyltransferase family protein [Patescibacteria group bacterium]